MAHERGLCKISFPVLKRNQKSTQTQGSAHLEFWHLAFSQGRRGPEATSFASFLCSLRKRGVPSCPVGGSLLDALVSLQGLCLLSGHPEHSESRLGGEGCLGFLSAPEASPETRGLVGSEGPTGCQRLGRDVLTPPVSPPLPSSLLLPWMPLLLIQRPEEGTEPGPGPGLLGLGEVGSVWCPGQE